MKNYYEILEVNKKASKEIIEKAYRVLEKRYHQDLYNSKEGDNVEQKIRDINEAYKILSDDFLREQYDSEMQKERDYNEQFKNRMKKQYTEKKEHEKQFLNLSKTKQQNKETQEVYNIGTLSSMSDLIKEIFSTILSRKKEKKRIQKEDIKAAALTAIIMIIFGIILWLIPATRGFIRSLVPF